MPPPPFSSLCFVWKINQINFQNLGPLHTFSQGTTSLVCWRNTTRLVLLAAKKKFPCLTTVNVTVLFAFFLLLILHDLSQLALFDQDPWQANSLNVQPLILAVSAGCFISLGPLSVASLVGNSLLTCQNRVMWRRHFWDSVAGLAIIRTLLHICEMSVPAALACWVATKLKLHI